MCAQLREANVRRNVLDYLRSQFRIVPTPKAPCASARPSWNDCGDRRPVEPAGLTRPIACRAPPPEYDALKAHSRGGSHGNGQTDVHRWPLVAADSGRTLGVIQSRHGRETIVDVAYARRCRDSPRPGGSAQALPGWMRTTAWERGKILKRLPT